jgi:ClpX C4-type zinc finger
MHNINVIGWGKREATRKLLRQDCEQVAAALSSMFTNRRTKAKAAALLLNISVEIPVCQFCGGGERDVNCLVESPFNPTVLICDWCAKRAVAHMESIRRSVGDAAVRGAPTGDLLRTRVQRKRGDS